MNKYNNCEVRQIDLTKSYRNCISNPPTYKTDTVGTRAEGWRPSSPLTMILVVFKHFVTFSVGKMLEVTSPLTSIDQFPPNFRQTRFNVNKQVV